MFDGLDCTFRTVKLRPSQKTCSVCGDKPTIHHLVDYEQFCGMRASDKVGCINEWTLEFVPVTYFYCLVTLLM